MNGPSSQLDKQKTIPESQLDKEVPKPEELFDFDMLIDFAIKEIWVHYDKDNSGTLDK